MKIHTWQPIPVDGTITMPFCEWRCPHGCLTGHIGAADPKREVAEQILEDAVERHENDMHAPEIRYRQMLAYIKGGGMTVGGVVRFPVVRGWDRSDRGNGSAKT